MVKEIQGGLQGQGLKIAIVVSRFNLFVTSRLLQGAKQALLEHGLGEEDMAVVWVPGAFEISLATKRIAQLQRYSAIVCLGAVIRGETPHFDYVAGEAARGIAETSLSCGVPITFGVVTANNVQQALDRAGGKVGNRGQEAALAAIEMANLMRKRSEEF